MAVWSCWRTASIVCQTAAARTGMTTGATFHRATDVIISISVGRRTIMFLAQVMETRLAAGTSKWRSHARVFACAIVGANIATPPIFGDGGSTLVVPLTFLVVSPT